MTKIEIERDEYVKLKADLDLAAHNGLKLLKENINLKSEAKTKKEEVTSLQSLLEKGFPRDFRKLSFMMTFFYSNNLQLIFLIDIFL